MERYEVERFFKESRCCIFQCVGYLSNRQGYYALVLRVWNLLQTLWWFIEGHYRLYMLTWCVYLGMPLSVGGIALVVCLQPSHDVARAIACWSLVFTACFLGAMIDKVKAQNTKSALDNALTA